MKIHLPLWLVCTIFVLCEMLYGMTGAGGVKQLKQRSIGRFPFERAEPLRIRAVKVGANKVKRNEKFVSDNDWLRTLTITVRNVTQKKILFASIDLVFPPALGSSDRLAIAEIDYGNRALLIRPPSAQEMFGLAPDQEIDMQLSAIGYDRIRSLLIDAGKSETQRVDLKVGRVIFADDSSWYGGSFQRSPNDPRVWINSEISAEAKNGVGLGSSRLQLPTGQESDKPLRSQLTSKWNSPKGMEAFPGFDELVFPVSFVRMPSQSSACYKKAWWGMVSCYLGAQCETKRELTDMTAGGYQFQTGQAMCEDVLHNYCGMGSTTVAIPCSFSGGSGGGGGGGGLEDFNNGYGESCSSDWDCDFGYTCDWGTFTCQ